MDIIYVISCFCFIKATTAAFQGLCGFGAKASKEECLKGSECPEGRTLVGRQYTLCFDITRGVGGVCCEKTPEPREQDAGCGTVTALTGRIGYGEVAPKCTSPWQVSIRTRDKKDTPISWENSLHWCGGTLIGRQHVLTTPLCLLSAGVTTAGDNVRDDVLVVAGDWDHTKKDYYGNALSEQYFRVSNWALHPDYPKVSSLSELNDLFQEQGEKGFHANGFAIIKLNQPITYTDCVKPACLTDSVNDMATSPCGVSNCKMTGWGNTEHADLKDRMQQATLTMPNIETCEAIEYYGNNMTSLPANTACALSPARPRAFNCVGDQGGPVVCRGEDGRWTLRGAVLARMLCDSGKPVPVADVTRVMDWVRNMIQNL